jgi:hypothetical protein
VLVRPAHTTHLNFNEQVLRPNLGQGHRFGAEYPGLIISFDSIVVGCSPLGTQTSG